MSVCLCFVREICSRHDRRSPSLRGKRWWILCMVVVRQNASFFVSFCLCICMVHCSFSAARLAWNIRFKPIAPWAWSSACYLFDKTLNKKWTSLPFLPCWTEASSREGVVGAFIPLRPWSLSSYNSLANMGGTWPYQKLLQATETAGSSSGSSGSSSSGKTQRQLLTNNEATMTWKQVQMIQQECASWVEPRPCINHAVSFAHLKSILAKIAAMLLSHFFFIWVLASSFSYYPDLPPFFPINL